MPESFDHKISNKIRSVFESYEEPFNEQAWNLMKEKLASKKRKRSLFFLDIAKAASLLLIVSLVIFVPFKMKYQKSKTSNLRIEKKNTNTITNEVSIITKNNEIIKTNTNYAHEDKANLMNDPLITETKDLAEKNNFKVIDTVSSDTFNTNQIYAENITIIEIDTVVSKKNSDSSENNDNRPILRPDDDDFFFDKRKEKKLKFALAVSSHYTSSDIGAKDNINFGGGFLTGYMLSERLSVNSGVFLANHDMSTQTTGILESFTKADSDNSLRKENAYIGNTETKIQLIGLDIPINIQLNFERFFVSTGVSSLVYLKQKYTEDYYVQNTSNVFNAETEKYETLYMYENVSITESESAFQLVDFAKLINISFGYRLPLKRGSLIFEPYAKIPTGSLTSYDISYGYGGFALKYRF